MELPEDPFMLLSFINMKLRDGDYENLEDLCQSLGCERGDIENKLNNSGFEYVETLRQFR